MARLRRLDCLFRLLRGLLLLFDVVSRIVLVSLNLRIPRLREVVCMIRVVDDVSILVYLESSPNSGDEMVFARVDSLLLSRSLRLFLGKEVC